MDNADEDLIDLGPNSELEPFKYQALNTSQQQIRLLHRDYDSRSTLLAWSLETWDLANAPPYRALSYAWGSEVNKKPILLDGKTFHVRQNLYDCLGMWDFPRGPSPTRRCLWVDQVSINQDDVEERNHQVSIMADIYRKAFEVMIWLGKESPHSAELIHFITTYQPVEREALKDIGVFDVVPPRRDMRHIVSSNGRRLFDDLYRREYWERLWPVQEILLAQSLFVRLGSFQLAWDTLRNFHTWMIHTNSDFNVLYDGLTFLFQNALRQTPCDYSSLIQPAVQKKCADPRDKLYGLMSLLPPEMVPQVDYAQSVEVTFLAAVRIIFAEWERNQQLVEVDLAVALEKCLMLGHTMLPDRDWELNMRSKTPYHDMARYMADTHLDSSCNGLLTIRRMHLEEFVSSKTVELAIELLRGFVSRNIPLMRFLRETRPQVASRSIKADQSWWLDD